MNRGQQAEALVAAWLEQRGYRVLGRNVHSRYGEIDVIAENGKYIAFTEVKCRAAHSMAHPLEAVTPQKQRRLVQTALLYLQEHPALVHLQPRFDAAAVTAAGDPPDWPIDYIENAFGE